MSLPIRIHNQVLFFLVAVGALAAVLSGFVDWAPNRLISGSPILLWAGAGTEFAAGIAALGAILLGASIAQQSKPLHCATATSAALLLLLVLAAAGRAAAVLAPSAAAASRISLGPAFWVLTACAILAVADSLQRFGAGIAVRVAVAITLITAVTLMAARGCFDALSIAREYGSRRQVFADALVRHMVLVGTSVGAALVLGLPLGVAAAKRSRLQGPVFAILNTLQTIPSIALFGLLIVPLSALASAVPRLGALGISGIGVTPAIIALVLYALLPVVRNTVVGLTNVDSASIDAGRGMGMSSRQIFWQVELPLSVPVLLAGLRIVTVQAIGLAVVAALIGAGGLGTFVFEGLGQYAVDLVLLGALPSIFLALAADFTLQILATVLRRRFAR
ncbi:MAG: ABC transporter permease [Alphaproteobacteria bacterium]|nr:ABC transporter permease [Alphaproteobacteria bacterium]